MVRAKNRREPDEIILSMLKLACTPCKLTHIVGKCNLNFKTARPYIKRLVDKKLLEFRDGYYSTTEIGRETIKVVVDVKSHCIICGIPLRSVHQKTLEGQDSTDRMPVCVECKVRNLPGKIMFYYDGIQQGWWTTCSEEEYQAIRKVVEAKKTRSGKPMKLRLPNMPPRSRFVMLDKRTFDAVAYARLSEMEQHDILKLENWIAESESEADRLREELLRVEADIEVLTSELEGKLNITPVALPKGMRADAAKAKSS